MSEPESKKLEEAHPLEEGLVRLQECFAQPGRCIDIAQAHETLGDALAALRERDEEIARLHTRMNMLFGYISTLPPWTNKHPEEVKLELLARIEAQK